MIMQHLIGASISETQHRKKKKKNKQTQQGLLLLARQVQQAPVLEDVSETAGQPSARDQLATCSLPLSLPRGPHVAWNPTVT
jgi:hypothetical protein